MLSSDEVAQDLRTFTINYTLVIKTIGVIFPLHLYIMFPLPISFICIKIPAMCWVF